MKFQSLILTFTLATVNSFLTPATIEKKQNSIATYSYFGKNDDNNNILPTKIQLHEKINKVKHSYFHKNDELNMQSIASLFTLSLLSATPLANAAENGLIAYPKTAIIVNTNNSASSNAERSNFVKAEIDGKKLLQNIYKNRKELEQSSTRILDYTKSELSRPEWIEVGRELLDIEGDLLPDIKVQVPVDWQAAIKGATKGKVDLVINGELIAVDVANVKGLDAGEEEITIHVKGKRLGNFPSVMSVVDQQVKKSSPFWDFWDSSFELPNHTKVKKGNAILGSTALGVILSYIISYNYYLSEIEKEEMKMKTKKEKKVSFNEVKKPKSEPTIPEPPSPKRMLKRGLKRPAVSPTRSNDVLDDVDDESSTENTVDTPTESSADGIVFETPQDTLSPRRKRRFLARLLRRKDADLSNTSLLKGDLSNYLDYESSDGKSESDE